MPMEEGIQEQRRQERKEVHTEEPFACYRSLQCASGKLGKTQGGWSRLVALTPWCELCHEVRPLRARAGLCLSRLEKGAID
jgi:hypothetical protein